MRSKHRRTKIFLGASHRFRKSFRRMEKWVDNTRQLSGQICPPLPGKKSSVWRFALNTENALFLSFVFFLQRGFTSPNISTIFRRENQKIFHLTNSYYRQEELIHPHPHLESSNDGGKSDWRPEY